VRGDINAYIYEINDFVFFDVADEMISGLPVAKFMQSNGRFVGFDGKASLRLWSGAWANFVVELVNAELTSIGESLPRIPPVRGELSVDVPYQRLTITPEWIFAARQGRVFRNETVTDGYSVFNLRTSYVRPTSHMVHIASVTLYNLTNTLYRHHTSVIKDFVPQIRRGIKVGYSLRFF
jgi:iron complex outermembrane receptor protein